MKFVRLKTRSLLDCDFFEFTNISYDLRNVSILKSKRSLRVHYGSESLSSLASKTFSRFNQRGKKLSIVQNKIKVWTTEKCPSRFCKSYIGRVGSI